MPVADSKELYGIKFKDVIQGEEFYMRMVQALGKVEISGQPSICQSGTIVLQLIVLYVACLCYA